MSKSNGTLSPEDAKKTLVEDNKKRTEACRREVSGIMKRYNCSFDMVTIIRHGRVPENQVSIVANG